jgi:hypothetical protein
MIKPGESAAGSKGNVGVVAIESVADILERELQTVIQEWLMRVEQEPDLTRIPLNFEERTGHLPHLLHDVISRLRLEQGQKHRFPRPRPTMGICVAGKATRSPWR